MINKFYPKFIISNFHSRPHVILKIYKVYTLEGM